MFDIKRQPKLYLVDVWYQVSTRTASGWCLISNVNQNSIWLMFDIKCQPELHLVDVWYQMSTRTLSGWCLISIINRMATGWQLIFIFSMYMFSLHFRVCRFQKGIQFWHFFVIFARMKKHFSSNVHQNCIWLMFDIKRQPELYLVDIWHQSSNVNLQPHFGAIMHLCFFYQNESLLVLYSVSSCCNILAKFDLTDCGISWIRCKNGREALCCKIMSVNHILSKILQVIIDATRPLSRGQFWQCHCDIVFPSCNSNFYSFVFGSVRCLLVYFPVGFKEPL